MSIILQTRKIIDISINLNPNSSFITTFTGKRSWSMGKKLDNPCPVIFRPLIENGCELTVLGKLETDLPESVTRRADSSKKCMAARIDP